MHIAAFASMKKGLEHFIYRELLYLNQDGAEISLFPTKQGPGPYNPPPEWNVTCWTPLRVVVLQPWLSLRLGRRYWSVLHEALRYRAVSDFFLAAYFTRSMKEVDVLYATFGDRKLFVAYFCKQLLGRPLAVTLHAYELYANPNRPLFELALAHCDQIITVSEHNRELLGRKYGIPAERIEIVRYSLDLEEYVPQQKFVVLIVGFFVERKGHEVLFRALQKLDRDDVEVWVVGGPGAEQTSVDVPALVKELGIESQVAFFGTLHGPALKAVYRSCDVFCLPCRTEADGVSEGFPNVLIEAMAMGKPVITTRHVEIPRIIKEILVEENDADGLADAIELALSSSSLRERLSKQSRELAEKHFSSANASQTNAILKRLCCMRSGRSKARNDAADLAAPSSEPYDASRADTEHVAVLIDGGSDAVPND